MALFDGTLDDYLARSNIGDIGRAISNNIYGINHRQTPLPIPSNRTHSGFVFVTRPQLNLSDDNLKNIRELTGYLNTKPDSYERAIRCLLDPKLMKGANGLECPLIDNEMAFLPFITNTFKSDSGYPDRRMDTYSTKEGNYRESHTMPDGIVRIYSTYDLDITLQNNHGNFPIKFFDLWLLYMEMIRTGKMVGYPGYIVKNLMEYTCRVYRFTLDRSKRYVEMSYCSGWSFPVNNPIGGLLTKSSDKALNEENTDVTFQFKSTGAIYNDPITTYNFNKTVGIFKRAMRDDMRDTYMMKIPYNALELFNNRGYPYIDPETHELAWYIDKNYYAERLNSMAKIDIAPGYYRFSSS
jgi:hypothetical protein